MPGEVTAEGGIGDAVEELAGPADVPQLLLGLLFPEAFAVKQGPVGVVELLPHLGGDHVANLACIFPGDGDAVGHAVGIGFRPHQKLHHLLGPAGWIELIEQLPIATGVDQGQPGLGAAGGAIEGHGLTHLDDAGDVLSPLHVAVDPVERIGDAAQHGCSATIQVSLQPPPWEEFTTRDPRRRATRVRPPGLTQAPLPRST